MPKSCSSQEAKLGLEPGSLREPDFLASFRILSLRSSEGESGKRQGSLPEGGVRVMAGQVRDRPR